MLIPNSSFKPKPTLFKILVEYSILLIFISFFTSCKITQQSFIFKQIKNDTTVKSYFDDNLNLKIRKGDILSIKISSLNPAEDDIYNMSGGFYPGVVNLGGGTSSGSGGGTSSGSGGSSVSRGSGGGYSTQYLVDTFGNVQLHNIGFVHAGGTTLIELKDILEKLLQPYLKDPIVTANFLNHHVTVFGTGAGGATLYTMPYEPLTLLNLLAQTGGLNPTNELAKDVVIIRGDSSGNKNFKHINLENASFMNTPWFYIQPDDIVYITPNYRYTEVNRNISYFTAITSIVTSAVSLYFIFYSIFK